MNPPTQLATYAVLFLMAFGVVHVLTPLSIRMAKALGALDYPESRKVHAAPVPRLGGLAVAGGIAVSIAIGSLANPYLAAGLRDIRGMALGSLLILAVGVYDDIRNASPLLKIAVHATAAGVAIVNGTVFALASNPLAEQTRDYFDLGVLAIPVTLLWIVGLTNAMNLIDGLDGLATGIAMFASIALFLISFQMRAGVVTYLYTMIAGATLAFLRYNRYPAMVFLGDSGSTFIGFLLACLAVQGSQKSFTLTAVFIPIIVFGFPIFDATVTLVRRYLGGRDIHVADNHHIHHQLLYAGLTQRQVVWVLYGITIVFGIIGFTFTVLLDEYAAVILVIVGVLGGVLGKELNVFGIQRRDAERAIRHRTSDSE